VATVELEAVQKRVELITALNGHLEREAALAGDELAPA
jgi:hypothetical protein